MTHGGTAAEVSSSSSICSMTYVKVIIRVCYRGNLLKFLSFSMSSDYNPRRLVQVGAERVSNVANTDFPGHYPGEDHSWDLQVFKQVRLSKSNNFFFFFELSLINGMARAEFACQNPEIVKSFDRF